MVNPLKQLRKRLEGAKKILILGVGSEFLGDDRVGVALALALKNLQRNRKACLKFQALCAGTVPENFTGSIKKFKPSHLVIIDAADLGRKPGSIAILNPQDTAGISFSTHRLPTRIFANYILQSFPCEIIIVGIQPKALIFGQSLSKEVRQAENLLIKAFKEICFA